MRRLLTAVLATGLLVGLLAAPGHAFRIGVGGFGYRNLSLDEPPGTDFHGGSLLGAKARLGLIPMLGIEPMVTHVGYGDFDRGGIKIDASLLAFELNAILGGAGGTLGPHFYQLFGLGSYRIKTDPGDTVTKPGWTIGTGLEIVPWPNVGIDASARFRWINTEETAIKDLGLYAGVNIYFGS